MITESTMYWITRLDGLNALFVSLTAIGSSAIVAALIFTFIVFVAEESVSKAALRCVLWFSIATIISALASVFVPTTKEMAMIYTVPAITRSDFVQKDLPDLYDMGIKALKEQLALDKDK